MKLVLNPKLPRLRNGARTREYVALPVLFATVGAIGGALGATVLKKSVVGGSIIGAAIGAGMVAAAALEDRIRR